MNEMRQEFKAPWGRLLAGISSAAVFVLLFVAWKGHAEGELVWLLPLGAFLAVPFIVRGYAVENGRLLIRRVGWVKTFPLDELESVEIDPQAMHGSIRLFGNGGLFSFTGLYRNKRLGNYRSFVNDWKRSVVVRFANRTIVVSPDDPVAFKQALDARTNQ
ncbi:PH domain-containing protein [Pontiella sp.]|uniref:PH domain-containing protein n=1 Tax=Pontiella sp. TaxID=2837462 RepID=UPI003567B37D